MIGPVLQQTLAAVQAERPSSFDKSFKLLDRLLLEYGETDLAERLYQEIPLDCPWEVAASLFAILVWSMSDPGATALIDTANQWLLQGNDLRKIRIALNLDLYPFRERTTMNEVLSRIAARYPEVAPRCSELITGRQRERE
jgi:hypothetical protein